MTSNSLEIISAGELSVLFAEEQSRREQLLKQDTANGYIAVRDGYEVALSDIPTKVDLLKWMFHLAEKKWVTKELMMEFARRVCAVKGWNPHDSRLS